MRNNTKSLKKMEIMSTFEKEAEKEQNQIEQLTNCFVDGSCYDIPAVYLTRKEIDNYNKLLKKEGIDLTIVPFYEYIYPNKKFDTDRFHLFEGKKIKGKFASSEKLKAKKDFTEEEKDKKKSRYIKKEKKNLSEKDESYNELEQSNKKNISKDKISQKSSVTSKKNNYDTKEAVFFEKIKTERAEKETEGFRINETIREIEELSKDLSKEELFELCRKHRLGLFDNEIKIMELKEKSLAELENIKGDISHDIQIRKLKKENSLTIRDINEREKRKRVNQEKKLMKQINKNLKEQNRQIREMNRINDEENYFMHQLEDNEEEHREMGLGLNEDEEYREGQDRLYKREEDDKSEESLCSSVEG